MIYLFDDNKYRQMSDNYAINYKEKIDIDYKDIIVHYEIYPYSIKDFFDEKEISAILLHDSWVDTGSQKNQKDEIVARCKEGNIPFIVFSNQFIKTIYDENNNVKEIKKDRMYFYILNFLEDYKKTKKPNFSVLNLGNEYEKEKKILLYDKLNKIVMRNFKSFDYKVVFSPVKSATKSNEAYLALKELYEFTGQDFEELDNDFADQNSTAKEVLEEITKIFKSLKTTL
jgi:hypothetical protein